MRGGRQRTLQSGWERLVTELLRWLPAVTFFVVYVATQNFLYFSYAVGFALWPLLKMRREGN